MRSSVIFLVWLLAVTCMCKVRLIVQYTQRSSWLVSLDDDHLESFLQCLCVDTSIECNLRLDSRSGYATGMDVIKRDTSESVSHLLSKYMCTFFYSNHSVLCQRQSPDDFSFYNSTPLFVIDRPSQCELHCVEWSWTDQQTVSVYQINNYDFILRHNETNATCISTATISTSTLVTPSKQIITTATNVPATQAKYDGLVTMTTQSTPSITTPSGTISNTGPFAATNSVSDTSGDGLQMQSTTNTSPDHRPTLIAILQSSTNKFGKEDVNTIITTGIVVGVFVGGSVMLAITVIVILLCRRQTKPAVASKNKRDSPKNSKKLSHSGNRSGDGDPVHNYVNVVTDMKMYDMYVDNFNPTFNHAASHNSSSSYMPFIKTSGETTMYSNQSVYDNVKQPQLVGVTSDATFEINNCTMAHQLPGDKTKIHVSKTQSFGANSNTYTVPVDTHGDIRFIDTAHTYLQLQEDPVDGHNASTLRENASSPHYSQATDVNVCPVLNHTNSQVNSDTKQTIPLYNKLGEFGRNERNGYDEIFKTK